MDVKTQNKVALNFCMQPQLEPTWCWSAVGTSCALFYNAQSGWTQCKLASAAIVPSPGNCCQNPDSTPCDVIWYLQNKLNQGSFEVTNIADGFVEGAIPFNQLVAELNKGLLVAFRLKIDITGELEGMHSFGHFVVIAGYEQTDQEQNVVVYDSFFGTAEMPYEVFVNNYKCHGGAIMNHAVTKATITHTFFTVPNPIA